MININFNNLNISSGLGGMGGGFSPMGGMGGGFSPMTGFSGMGGGLSSMGGFGGMGGFGLGTMGGGFGAAPVGADPQAQMMSAMSMMSSMMMMMLSTMMTNLISGQAPMSMAPGQFGGAPGGSPLNNFLGGKANGKRRKASKANKANKAGKANKGSKKAGAAGSPTKMDPSGKVGDINVEKLINAIPSGYRANARKHWPSIVAEAQKQGIKSKGQLAYILATTVHESGAGKYMEEIASGSAYEGRSDLGNKRPGDGVRFKGRGYVQITGRNNYTNWGKKLGLNLVGNPELAERPEVAAKILVGGMKEGSFTGRGLSDYINGGKTDFVGARAIVNGSDKASTFAATAKAILSAMN